MKQFNPKKKTNKAPLPTKSAKAKPSTTSINSGAGLEAKANSLVNDIYLKPEINAKGKPKLGPLHGGKAPFFMVAQVPFNVVDAVELNTPMIQIMDDGGNVGVLSANLKDLGVYDLMLKSGTRSLEIGCGSAYQLEHFYQKGRGEYFGLEPILSEAKKGWERLSPLLKNKKLEVKKIVTCGEIEKVKYPEHSFDVIYSYHVFEHLENPLVMLEKAKLWLKPGGKLIITCPNVEGAIPKKDIAQWRCALPSHRWLPGRLAVARILRESGFELTKEFTYGGYTAPRTWWQEIANWYFKKTLQGDVLCMMATLR